jgi:glycosyltransferase involved in cell wall biosynthesis
MSKPLNLGEHAPLLTSSECAPGINLCGYLRDESGWGEAGRGYVRALQTLELPLALVDVSALSSNRSDDGTLECFDAALPYAMNLVCVDPSQHYGLLSQRGPEFFEGHYTVGAWAWELPRFPENWRDRFAFYDEIWVTTSFVANALAPVAPIPVVRIPPVLTPHAVGSRPRGRARLRVRDDEFVFLFIFDFHSHLARKNPLATIAAFRQAFKPTDPARLVLKCVNSADDPQGFAQVRAAANDARIDIHAGYWSSGELQDVVAACDAYVSLHRSEGTGLTITDAMALGKPVIATGWSGNMDFMTVANSFPVAFELVELTENVGPYRAGETWADAAVEDAARWMRYVVEHPADALARGARAQSDIQANFSGTAIGTLIRERLTVIERRKNLNAFREATWNDYFDYRRLIQHARAIAAHALPPEATVMVVTKGDSEFLDLGGRVTWHFPQTEDGKWLGYHPADSRAAIEHLEALRVRGGDYLLFPRTAFWWLDYYADLRDWLEARYSRIWENRDCILFDVQ